MKRKLRILKQLKTLVCRVYRDIEHQLPDQPVVREAFTEIMQTTQRIMKKQSQVKNKLYGVHAPEVDSIRKGKVHKKYELDDKVGITVTN